MEGDTTQNTKNTLQPGTNTFEQIMTDLKDTFAQSSSQGQGGNKQVNLKEAVGNLREQLISEKRKFSQLQEQLDKTKQDKHDTETNSLKKEATKQLFSQEKAVLISRIQSINNKVIEYEKQVPGLRKSLKTAEFELLGKRADYAGSEAIRSSQNSKIKDLESEVTMWKKLYETSTSSIKKLVDSQAEVQKDTNVPKLDKKYFEKLLDFGDDFKLSSDIELILAKDVIENDLKELKKHIETEETLRKEIQSQKSKSLEKEREQDTIIAGLREKYESLQGDFESLLSAEDNIDISNITQEQIRSIIVKLKNSRIQNKQLKEKLKGYAKMWTETLDSRASNDIEVFQLQKSYSEMQKSFQELEEEAEKKFDEEIRQKVKSRDQTIKDQALQIQKLLFENHKLREYMNSRYHETIVPLEFENFSKNMIQKSQDREFYESLDGLVDQNKNLRSKIYLLETSSSNGSQKSKSEYNKLMKMVEEGKGANKQLLDSVKKWKEGTQKLLTEKTELQGRIYDLKQQTSSKIAKLEKQVQTLLQLKEELLNQVSSFSSEASSKEIELLRAKQLLSAKESSILALQEENTELKTQVKKNYINDKSKVWEKIEIVIEPALEEAEASNIIKDLIGEVQDLLKENMLEIEESRKTSQEQKETSLKLQQLTDNCKTLEALLEQEKLKNNNHFTEIMQLVESVKNASKSSEFSEVLENLKIGSDLESYCPTIINLKLSEKIKELSTKYTELKAKITGPKEPKTDNLDNIEALKEKIEKLKEELETERSEKESILNTIKGENKGVFDAIKFKQIMSDNTALAEEVEDLKMLLAQEKQISQKTALKTEETMKKLHLLNEEFNSQQEIKNTIISQLENQRSIIGIQSTSNKNDLKYLETENELLKIKMDKMVEGIAALKKHMYGSLKAEERSKNKESLDELEAFISNISLSLQKLKNKHSAKTNEFKQESEERIKQVLDALKKNADVIDSLTSRDEKSYLKEIEDLRKEIDLLKQHNQKSENEMKEKQQELNENMSIIQEQNSVLRMEENLESNINMERITNALQKGIDMICVLKQQKNL